MRTLIKHPFVLVKDFTSLSKKSKKIQKNFQLFLLFMNPAAECAADLNISDLNDVGIL